MSVDVYRSVYIILLLSKGQGHKLRNFALVLAMVLLGNDTALGYMLVPAHLL